MLYVFLTRYIQSLMNCFIYSLFWKNYHNSLHGHMAFRVCMTGAFRRVTKIAFFYGESGGLISKIEGRWCSVIRGLRDV